VCEKIPRRKVAHQRVVDRRALEPELLDILGQRQLRQCDLVFDRPRRRGKQGIDDRHGSRNQQRHRRAAEDAWGVTLKARVILAPNAMVGMDTSVPERGDLSNAACLREAKPNEATATKNEFLTFLAR
jgi:hypothetical protein